MVYANIKRTTIKVIIPPIEEEYESLPFKCNGSFF
jgi:hypothetical protein